MATKTWTGSGLWNTAGNWSPSGVPASGDDVVIGTTAHSPVLSGSTTVNTIAINGSDTLTLIGAPILTVTNGITLSSTGGISGDGAVAAAITNSSAGFITATGGTLEVTGAITDSGAALALSISGATDTLLLDAASAAHTVTFGSGGTLELKLGATLAVGTAMAIGTGTVQLDGSTLTDSSGVTIGTGTIRGAGTVAAAVTASGAAHITATGGTLVMTGKITDSGNGLTLTIESGGNLTLAGFQSITNGTIKISTGGQLSDSAGFNIGSGAVLVGSGKVTGPIFGTGIVEASGGTLELVSPIAASDGTSFEIANSLLATLLLDSAPGSGNTFSF
jgi:hypothetical protein